MTYEEVLKQKYICGTVSPSAELCSKSEKSQRLLHSNENREDKLEE